MHQRLWLSKKGREEPLHGQKECGEDEKYRANNGPVLFHMLNDSLFEPSGIPTSNHVMISLCLD